MAHFAKLDENNVVTQVIVVDNKDTIDPHTGQEDEIIGIAFCKKLLGGNWKQTSYNNNLRVRYAGIGYSYNAALDAFVPPQPFASWINTSSENAKDRAHNVAMAALERETELALLDEEAKGQLNSIIGAIGLEIFANL